jgi:hypothetical protein
MANKNLRAAKAAKNDEFYTQLADIEKELRHYSDQLRGKVIFCNCDDPFESNFFKYFAMNFNQLGLKKLIATCYDPSPIAGMQLALFDVALPLKKGMSKNTKHAYKIEITEVKDYDGSGSTNLSDVEYLLKHDGNALRLLEGDGDFRSKECIELLKEADVVVTNPPFSLFLEYIALLIEFKKKFIVMGNVNSLHKKAIFKLIKSNDIWTGYGFNQTCEFVMPDHYEKWDRIENGKKIGKVPAITWFTNLDVAKHHEQMILYKKYSPEEYTKYDNLDAIEISKVAEVPENYNGLMGVPDTFLENFNPDQFELIGIPFGDLGKEIGVTRNYRGRTDISITRNGKTSCPYSRIIIKRKETIDDN